MRTDMFVEAKRILLCGKRSWLQVDRSASDHEGGLGMVVRDQTGSALRTGLR